MPGARSRRLRAQDGGRAQGGDPAVLGLARQLQAALQPRPRGLPGTGRTQRPSEPRTPEWCCGACKAPNWASRAHCRRCGHAKAARPPPPTAKTAADLKREAEAAARRAAALKQAAEAKATAEGAAPQQDQGSDRPPAPEARSAESAAQAAALESSAAALRAAGLGDRAAELDADAARLRKRVAAPPPGRRLDLAEAYCGRCEVRARKAADAVAAAEQALALAEQPHAAALQELDDARAQVLKLRDDLAAGPATMDTTDNGGADDFVASVRALADAVERWPAPGHVGTGPALPAAALVALAAVRRRLDPPGTVEAATLDTPLAGTRVPGDGGGAEEAAAAAAAGAPGTPPGAEANGEAGDNLQRLAADHLDDAALGAAVRQRLRYSPYAPGR